MACCRIVLACLCALTLRASAAVGAPRVELEVATQSGLSPNDGRRWNDLLTESGISSVRLRARRGEEQPSMQTQGADGSAIKIVGVLTSQGTLALPGGQFSLNDKTKLSKWIGDLSAGGVEGLKQPKAAFGLTPKQLEQVLKELSQPVDFTTKGLPPAEAIEKIRLTLTLPLTVTPELTRALRAEDAVRDELKGVTAGTALAVILRPAGAMLQPTGGVGKKPALLLSSSKAGAEPWPIGWPPVKQNKDVLPTLFEFLTVEIAGVSAEDALAALQGRLKTPFLYDHNAMAQHEIDLAKTVNVPGKRSFYGKVLDRVTFQAGLKWELREDEAGKAIIWITTLKRT